MAKPISPKRKQFEKERAAYVWRMCKQKCNEKTEDGKAKFCSVSDSDFKTCARDMRKQFRKEHKKRKDE